MKKDEKKVFASPIHIVSDILILIASLLIVFDRMKVIKDALESGVYKKKNRAGAEVLIFQALDPASFRNNIITELVVVGVFTFGFCFSAVILTEWIQQRLEKKK